MTGNVLNTSWVFTERSGSKSQAVALRERSMSSDTQIKIRTAELDVECDSGCTLSDCVFGSASTTRLDAKKKHHSPRGTLSYHPRALHLYLKSLLKLADLD